MKKMNVLTRTAVVLAGCGFLMSGSALAADAGFAVGPLPTQCGASGYECYQIINETTSKYTDYMPSGAQTLYPNGIPMRLTLMAGGAACHPGHYTIGAGKIGYAWANVNCKVDSIKVSSGTSDGPSDTIVTGIQLQKVGVKGEQPILLYLSGTATPYSIAASVGFPEKP